MALSSRSAELLDSPPYLDHGRIFNSEATAGYICSLLRFKIHAAVSNPIVPPSKLNLPNIIWTNNRQSCLSCAIHKSYSAQQRLFSLSLPFSMKCLRPTTHTNSGLIGLVMAWQPTQSEVIEIRAHVASRLGFWAPSSGHTRQGMGLVKSQIL